MEHLNTEIRKHHKRAIENLIREYENDTRFLALIIGGSVAKGCARHDSDVDFMIIATDEEYNHRSFKNNLFINRTDLCDYPNGFVDGKIINMKYLKKVAKKGNEPSRAAFDGAIIGYSHIDGLDHILKKINRYPEKNREERIKSFYCMAFIQNWLMGEADRHNSIYTKTRAASQLALYAGRLILAYNRVLFPYHKWFIHYLEKCPEKPNDFIENMNSLLEVPNLKNANALFKSVKEFKDWGISDIEAYMWFMEKVEWSWMKGNTSLENI